jgi:hypothetical protein
MYPCRPSAEGCNATAMMAIRTAVRVFFEDTGIPVSDSVYDTVEMSLDGLCETLHRAAESNALSESDRVVDPVEEWQTSQAQLDELIDSEVLGLTQ